jgi:hypothetical protein
VAYDSARRGVLYNIGVRVKLARLIKMCLNEFYITVHIGERMSDQFPIKVL